MRPGLNKKVLVFVDEYGTAGHGDLYLGAVFVLARDAGRLDKRFSDLLEPSAPSVPTFVRQIPPGSLPLRA